MTILYAFLPLCNEVVKNSCIFPENEKYHLLRLLFSRGLNTLYQLTGGGVISGRKGIVLQV